MARKSKYEAEFKLERKRALNRLYSAKKAGYIVDEDKYRNALNVKPTKKNIEKIKKLNARESRYVKASDYEETGEVVFIPKNQKQKRKYEKQEAKIQRDFKKKYQNGRTYTSEPLDDRDYILRSEKAFLESKLSSDGLNYAQRQAFDDYNKLLNIFERQYGSEATSKALESLDSHEAVLRTKILNGYVEGVTTFGHVLKDKLDEIFTLDEEQNALINNIIENSASDLDFDMYEDEEGLMI